MRARDDNSSFGIVLWVKFRSSSPMTKVPFVKYHGAGNDFILIDDREGHWGDAIEEAWIEKVCYRRFGIGADGLILLQSSREGSDFFMKYYNSDGRTSTGSRGVTKATGSWRGSGAAISTRTDR